MNYSEPTPALEWGKCWETCNGGWFFHSARWSLFLFFSTFQFKRLINRECYQSAKVEYRICGCLSASNKVCSALVRPWHKLPSNGGVQLNSAGKFRASTMLTGTLAWEKHWSDASALGRKINIIIQRPLEWLRSNGRALPFLHCVWTWTCVFGGRSYHRIPLSHYTPNRMPNGNSLTCPIFLFHSFNCIVTIRNWCSDPEWGGGEGWLVGGRLGASTL